MKHRRMTTALATVILIAMSTPCAFGEETEEDLAMAAQNPLADLISVPFQNNTSFNIGPYNRTANVLNIQPVIPFGGGRWITRTILPVVWQPDILSEDGMSTGLGDMTFTAFYTPDSEGVTWGVGPILMFPTGGKERGSQKWGLGPSAVVVAMSDPWVIGALVNNVWSIAGDEDAADVNMMTFQYFINYNFPSFYLSSAPIITANWEAPEGQQWVVPVGIGIGKVMSLGKLPVNLSAQYFYNVVTPDHGPEYTVRVQLQFLLPKSVFGG